MLYAPVTYKVTVGICCCQLHFVYAIWRGEFISCDLSVPPILLVNHHHNHYKSCQWHFLLWLNWNGIGLNSTVMFRLRLIYLSEMHTVHSCTVPLVRNVKFPWLFSWSKQVFYIFKIPSIGIFVFQGLFVFINILKAKVNEWEMKVHAETMLRMN